MARAYVVPIGYIECQTGEGATFILNNAEDSKSLRTNTPVTVWRYSPEHLALAKILGFPGGGAFLGTSFGGLRCSLHASSLTLPPIHSTKPCGTRNISQWPSATT